MPPFLPSFFLFKHRAPRLLLLLAGLGCLVSLQARAQAPALSSFAPASGVAGTAVTLTGSGFTGATAVSFNNMVAAAFTVNSGTSLTAVVPADATTGLVRVTTAGGTGSSASSFVVLQPSARAAVVMDGYRETLYGSALAVQVNPTGFGNAVNGSQTASLNGSELDAAYAYVSGDSLHVFLAGNVENNNNALDIFFDSQPGGQNTLATLGASMPYNNIAGLTFDQGFTADYVLVTNNSNSTVIAQFANINTGLVSAYTTSSTRSVALPVGNYTSKLSIDQSNTGGVDDAAVYGAAPAGVVTGVEFVLPLAALGSPTGSLKIAAFLSNGNQDYLSNQSLGALPNGTANLTTASAVNFNNYAGNQYFTVTLPQGPPVTSFTPANGVAGTAVTLTGTGFSGATAVSFNGTAAASYVVNSSTSITAVVPVAATTGPIIVTTAAGLSSSASFVVNQPQATRIFIDGYRETRYGTALAAQTATTGFGNAVNGSQTTALNGSELDAAYTYVHGDSLYVFLAGNIENNGNEVEVFFDSQTGGQNVLASTNPNVDNNGLNAMAGLVFDQGFTADYYLSLKGSTVAGNVVDAYFASLGTAGTGVSPASASGGLSQTLNLPGGRTGRLGIDNSNTGGVSDVAVGAGVPNAVVTGLEFALPLAALGYPSGSLRISTFVNGGGHGYLSNQVLGGLPNGTANLTAPNTVNFDGYAGNQYFTVSLPALTPAITTFSPMSGPVGTSVTITGTNLGSATSVSFNGVPTASFTVNPAGTQLTAVVFSGATAGLLSVTTPYGTATSAVGFCVQYPVATTDGTRCGPGTVTLSASGAPASGTYSYYSAASGGTALGTSATFTTPSLNTSATYYVGITTGSGNTACEGPRTAVTATVNPLPTAAITASGATTFCQGGSVVLTAAAATSYQWSTGATTQSITVAQSGSYTVTVSNGTCPVTSAATTVTVNPLPTASITATGTTTFCQGGSVVLTASTGSTYTWNTGATTQSITVTQGGSYTVTISNGSNCTATSAATTVTVNPLPTASVTAAGATTFCQGGSVVLTAAADSSYLWSTGATTQSITVAQAGSYAVTVGNAAGCSATSAPTTVTVNPTPTQPTVTQTGTGSGTTFTSNATSGNQWYQNGVAIAGATGQAYVPTSSGTYTVVVTSVAGCASPASAGQAIVLATTSAALATQVQVFPNPTHGEVTLNLPSSVVASAARVQVLNALGQEVPARAVVTTSSVKLDLTGLAAGVYAVRVQLGADTLVKRVVLE